MSIGYWKAASTGVAWRRIGKFWTDGSGNILPFSMIGRGRYRQYRTNAYNAVLPVSAQSSASFTPITLTPYIGTDDDRIELVLLCVSGASSNASMQISVDGGTSSYEQPGLAPLAAAGQILFPRFTVPNTGSLDWKGDLAANVCYVGFCGLDFYV